jgi:hypothetical protein
MISTGNIEMIEMSVVWLKPTQLTVRHATRTLCGSDKTSQQDHVNAEGACLQRK